MAEEDPSRRVTSVLQPFVESGFLAGAVTLVADRSRVLSLEAVGFADVAAGKPMQVNTLFWIASQTKPITATALMMLVDEGKLSLDDSLSALLPEFVDLWLIEEQDDLHLHLRRPRQSLTVRHLLNHTSGMPFASAMEAPTLDRLMLQDAARSYSMTPLQSEPGSRYQYSNAGINTAGRLIETISGMPYEAFLSERLFEPLGMADTVFRPTADQLKRLARPYRPNADKTGLEETTISQLSYPLDNPSRQPMPAGGLFSTAEDVVRFCWMILNRGVFEGKRYLSEEAIAQMTRRQTGKAIETSYGLGWSVDGSTFGHGGALSTQMSIDSALGRITLFLVQHAGFPGNGDQSFEAFKKAAINI